MPGNVSNATPTTVLPWSLCKQLVLTSEYLIRKNDYPSGESQRSLITTTGRRRWQTVRRLTPLYLALFRDFFDARKGSYEPFYFYYPFETSPKFSYDPTGQATTGRYTVRFDSNWQQAVGLARSDATFAIIEIA